MEKFSKNKGVSLYAYKGDAMTLLAFDLEEDLVENFVGFTVNVSANGRSFYLYNKMKFKSSIKLPRQPVSKNELLSSEFSPFQKFRWIHVPSTIHFVDNPFFGDYTYKVTPRYVIGGKLQPMDDKLTAEVTIDVSPFKDGDIAVGFTRSFISSQAFGYWFGNQLNLKPDGADLVFNIKDVAGEVERTDNQTGVKKKYSFTYQDIHEYLGWQAHDRVMEFLDEVVNDTALELDVFAYDLNEPQVVEKLLLLAQQGRMRILLDDYPNHREDGCDEMKFEEEYKNVAQDPDSIYRGHFGSQAHSKVFIQRKATGRKGVKVLTGSTNFTLNGLYINANHTLVFNNASVAQQYADVFDASFGDDEMSSFKTSVIAKKDFQFDGQGLPDMTIRFSPHPKSFVDTFFNKIEKKILNAESDVLFAIMKDDSKSQILDAVKEQVASDQIFTAGITDVRDGMTLYKPNSKRGIRISGLKIATKLPKPFNDIIRVPGLGHSIHHKFIVVDFKGKNPVVYCGSSNLAYDPEQKNGDNLLEIRDKDVVTAFAIEAIRLIDHFHWLNKLVDEDATEDEMTLYDDTEKKKWYKPYYNTKDLKCLERMLLMK